MIWKKLEGRKVFVRLTDGTHYEGVVDFVDDSSLPIIFITMKDKYGKYVTFNHEEIIKIIDEGEGK